MTRVTAFAVGRCQLGLLLTLVSLVALGSLTTSAVAAGPADLPGSTSGPVLTGAAAAQPTGTITVTGEAFTPGGQAYVALYDQLGAQLYETRWLTASPTIYGRNGSLDPATGFSRGGTLSETFGQLCGATVMVRAYDQPTKTWSNWLDLASECGRRGY